MGEGKEINVVAVKDIISNDIDTILTITDSGTYERMEGPFKKFRVTSKRVHQNLYFWLRDKGVLTMQLDEESGDIYSENVWSGEVHRFVLNGFGDISLKEGTFFQLFKDYFIYILFEPRYMGASGISGGCTAVEVELERLFDEETPYTVKSFKAEGKVI